MIGAVLVTYFRRRLSEFAIKTLHETTKRSDIYLVVVDNNSPDDSPEILTKMKERGEIDYLILNSENRHMGVAVNQGIDHLKTVPNLSYFMSFDQDFFFMEGWLQNAHKVMNHLKLNYIMLVYLEGISNKKVAHAHHEIAPNGGTFGRLTSRKPKRHKFDKGAGFLIYYELMNKYNIRFEENRFSETYIGPGVPIFRLMQEKLGLKGARLHKPCLLLQDPEFNNPEYIEYYKYIHGIRGMAKTYRMYCWLGPVLDPDEYYRGSGYKITEFYSLGQGVPCDWGWDKNLEKWK